METLLSNAYPRKTGYKFGEKINMTINIVEIFYPAVCCAIGLIKCYRDAHKSLKILNFNAMNFKMLNYQVSLPWEPACLFMLLL